MLFLDKSDAELFIFFNNFDLGHNKICGLEIREREEELI